MELIEILRLIQEGNNQLTAEQTAAAIQAVADQTSKNHNDIQNLVDIMKSNDIQELMILIVATCAVIMAAAALVYLDKIAKKLKVMEKQILERNL